jgi:carbamoyl-phosphate synthase large subunit
MGWDRSFARAFLKAQMGAGVTLPDPAQDGGATAFLSIKDADKTPQLTETARLLAEMGFRLVATSGTARFLASHGLAPTRVAKHHEGGRTIVDVLKDGEVALVMNTTEGAQAVEDSRAIRNVALMDRIPYYTTLAGAHAAALAMRARAEGAVEVRALQ